MLSRCMYPCRTDRKYDQYHFLAERYYVTFGLWHVVCRLSVCNVVAL